MSRSGYTDDCENLGLWRGAVASAINGKRGQAFLKEIIAALDAMPNKELITNTMLRDGQVCTLGAVGVARGADMERLNRLAEYEDAEAIASVFKISRAMAAEIMYLNDEGSEVVGSKWEKMSPARRWQRMRDWAEESLNKPEPSND